MINKLLPARAFERLQTALRLTILTVMLGVAGCSRIGVADNSKQLAADPNVGAAAVNQPLQPALKPMMAMTDMPFEQLVNATSGLLDDFWRQSFKDMHWQATYSAPKGLIPYSEPTRSDCGMLTTGSAFYCPADQNIYFDDYFMRGLYQDSGDIAVVTVLAHEWGHSVQRDIGITGGNDKLFVSIDAELQADCFAGAFFRHISELGYIEEPEVETESIFATGARQNLKWFDPLAHGKAFQRGAYLDKGLEGGVKACMAR